MVSLVAEAGRFLREQRHQAQPGKAQHLPPPEHACLAGPVGASHQQGVPRAHRQAQLASQQLAGWRDHIHLAATHWARWETAIQRQSRQAIKMWRHSGHHSRGLAHHPT